MNKVLITGITGQLGFELMNAMQGSGQLEGLSRKDADLAQISALQTVIRQYQPDIILNPAAYTAVDKAEQEPSLAYQVNATAPGILAEEAQKIGALLIHFSTDYVFDGQKIQPYKESDPVNPVNVYGQTKLAGEQAIQAVGGDYLILRTAWVYSLRRHNFLNSMIHLLQEKDQLGVVNDQIGTPTSAKFLAEITARMIKKVLNERQQGQFKSAIYHLTAAGQASWYQFACAIKKHLEKQHKLKSLARLKPITTREYPTPAKRAQYSVLDCNRIINNYSVMLPEWQSLLELAVKNLVFQRPAK